MDLCLRGSQINLAEREKPKPKYTSQVKLDSRARPRPRSATFIQKRSRSSPFLCRPQSADPKCGHHSSSVFDVPICSSFKYRKPTQKQLQNLSSSNLLKLLLEEPIKRSWLCRSNSGVDFISGEGSSPDDQSEVSTSRRHTESIGSSSIEGNNSNLHSGNCSILLPSSRSNCIIQRKGAIQRMSSTTSLTTSSREKTVTNNYWRVSSASSYTMKTSNGKPDLPGRVSFCKPNMAIEMDSSDCDNDKQEHLSHSINEMMATSAKKGADRIDSNISAPGPVSISDYSYDLTQQNQPISRSELSSAGLKKSVHFGATNGADVVAETYEYPKCPSENCSCSTRSSSTASIHDVLDTKCACDSPTCKYAIDKNTKSSLLGLNGEKQKLESESLKDTALPSPIEESKVIQEYKNVVGSEVKSTVAKNILEDNKASAKPSSFGSLNNTESSSYYDTYSTSLKSDLLLEKQNNLSESKLTFNGSSKSNLLTNTANEFLKTGNNFESNLSVKPTYSSSSESVINNYLKVAATAVPKNKDNNNKSTISKNLPKLTNNFRKSKVITSHSLSTTKYKPERAKLKKAISYGSLKDDSNLNEFHLDKVDSWMSMHEDTLGVHKQSMTKHSSLDGNMEKLTKDPLELMLKEIGDDYGGGENSQSSTSTKSNDNSEDDTYDEIVSVIKEIEEDKKKGEILNYENVESIRKRILDNYAERPMPEMDLPLSENGEPAENDSKPGKRDKDPAESPDKYKDILNYLDNVEDSCDKTLLETRRSMPDTNRSEIEFIVEPDIAEDVPKLCDLLMVPNHQLARRVIALSLRANELANAVHLSKEHILKIKTEKQKLLRAEKATAVNRLKDQRKHYEQIVKRHQGFIEQLLKDKGTLCEKLAALTRRLESQNQAWEHKLETEVARVKETTLAGEKIRRERWVRENTKRIKELTVKGLEAEINRMTCTHQHDINELKRAHQEQLLNALEEARIKHEQMENSIRESCAQDRETIIEKERAAIRERFERQLEEERQSFNEQRQKLLDDFASERERLQKELKTKDIESQSKRQEALRERESEYEQTIAALQERMSKQEEKYQSRINTIEKQYESDFEIWKKEYENSCRIEQVEKENAIRQHYRAERDRQIDAIVSRMDAESEKNAEEFDSKLNRLKEKYDKDLKELEKVEKSLREKYTVTRTKLAESDAQVRNAQAEMKQLALELDHSKKMCDDFLAERDQIRENLRNEMQAEVANLKQERDNEIQKIHKRVQQAIEKKDTTIDILHKENGDLRERCLKLEAVIRQQRKDYCVK